MLKKFFKTRKLKFLAETFIILKISVNNVFINILNKQGTTLFLENLGTSGYKGRSRKYKQGKTTIAINIARRLFKFKIKQAYLILKGIPQDRVRILRGLLSRGLKIKYCIENTNIPFNGCRLKKKKRRRKKKKYTLFFKDEIFTKKYKKK